MTPEQALHTFARRYCIERGHEWTSKYASLVATGGDRRGADYTREAYDMFPRYNVLHAIQLDVEQLDFDRLPPLNELSELLAIAGRTATSELNANLRNPIARDAEQAERQLFVDAIQRAAAARSLSPQPLYYRRTLRASEVEVIWRKVRSVWGMKTGYWYPLDKKSHPSLVAFKLESIDAEALQRRIKAFFAQNRIVRIWELREFGRENYCVEAGANDLFYGTGGEGYWTTDSCDWIVYCSHEGTITLGGSIVTIAPSNPLTEDWI